MARVNKEYSSETYSRNLKGSSKGIISIRALKSDNIFPVN